MGAEVCVMWRKPGSKRLLVVIFGMQTVAPWEHLAWSRVLLERDSCDVLGFGKALTHWSYCRIFFVDHIV